MTFSTAALTHSFDSIMVPSIEYVSHEFSAVVTVKFTAAFFIFTLKAVYLCRIKKIVAIYN